jgi:hypothetical protein
MPSPIAEAAARYRVVHARTLAEANEAADLIRRDYGMPRDRRQWTDHPRLWNDLNTQVVTRLEQARTKAVAELRAAREESRRWLYRIPVSHDAGLNRTMAEASYRAAREAALALPLGEVGLGMALERARMAATVGDEPMLAALSLLAEERTQGQRGSAWDRISEMWAQSSSNKFTKQRLDELQEADAALDQLAAPARFSLPRLTRIEPEPEPAPSLSAASGDGSEPPAMG